MISTGRQEWVEVETGTIQVAFRASMLPDHSGIGDLFVMFAGSQDILMESRGVIRVKSSSVYLVVKAISLLRRPFGSGRDTMPSDAPNAMNDIPL